MTSLGPTRKFVEDLFNRAINRLTSHNQDPDAHGLSSIVARLEALEKATATQENPVVIDEFLTDGALMKSTNNLDWSADGTRPVVGGGALNSPVPSDPGTPYLVYRIATLTMPADSVMLYRAQARLAEGPGGVRLMWGGIGGQGTPWVIDRSSNGYLSLSHFEDGNYVVKAENNLAPGSQEQLEVERNGNRVIVRIDGRILIDHRATTDDVRADAVGIGMIGAAKLLHYSVSQRVKA